MVVLHVLRVRVKNPKVPQFSVLSCRDIRQVFYAPQALLAFLVQMTNKSYAQIVKKFNYLVPVFLIKQLNTIAYLLNSNFPLLQNENERSCLN